MVWQQFHTGHGYTAVCQMGSEEKAKELQDQLNPKLKEANDASPQEHALQHVSTTYLYIVYIVHRSREERLLIQNLNLAGVALTLKCLRDVKSELSFFVCSPNSKCRVYSMRDWHSGFGHKGLWLKRRTQFMTTIMGYTKHYETMEFMIEL